MTYWTEQMDAALIECDGKYDMDETAVVLTERLGMTITKGMVIGRRRRIQLAAAQTPKKRIARTTWGRARMGWHAEARELYAKGATIREIATVLDKRYETVRHIVKHYTEHAAGVNPRCEASFIKQHVPRKIPKPKHDAMAVARLFAAGQIDRAELSRRLGERA